MERWGRRTVVLVFGLWVGLLGMVWAEEVRPTVDLGTDVFSQYVWRGFALSDDSVVLQPSLTVSYRGAYVNFWGNFDTDRNNEHDKSLNGADWNETDFTLGYTYEQFPYGLTLEVGSIYYALEGDDSLELYAGLSATCPKTGIHFGFTVYREISHFPALWYELSLARDFTFLRPEITLNLSVSAMYLDSQDQGAYPDPDDPRDEFSDWLYLQLGAEISFPLGKYLTVTPKVYYSFSLSDDADHLLEEGSWDNHHDHFFGGLGLSFSF